MARGAANRVRRLLRPVDRATGRRKRTAVSRSSAVAGDAGFGPEAIDPLLAETHAVLRRVTAHPELWGRAASVPAGTALRLPALGSPPHGKTEETDPWQVAMGDSFTLGLPPGFRARRLDGEVPPPVQIAGGKLWFRGRFEDTEGTEVIVGDGTRVGYVAEVSGPATEWVRGKQPPLAAPTAKRAAGDTFSLLEERTGCRSGRAERWVEPGFDGNWLVFRLAFADRGVEIALPVLAGRRSASLFWIPASWRDAAHPPASPPVDPAARFGVRFDRFGTGERARRRGARVCSTYRVFAWSYLADGGRRRRCAPATVIRFAWSARMA